jgi:uncharacterized protein YecA (UPF0149 family)
MGAIADSIAAYAQPLFDETDGSLPQVQRAMAIAQMCWNLAILSEGEREKAIEDMKPALEMTDEEFADFRQDVILPMIQRHHAMFPGLNKGAQRTSSIPTLTSSPTKKYPGTDRYAPCPCGSGRKYKWCCGASK